VTNETCYFLVDGENIDRTLGQILDAKPRSNQRPRWDKIRKYVDDQFGDSRALFFLNAGRGLPGPFIQALRLAGYTPVPLQGPEDVKVVDAAIIKMMAAIAENKPHANVCLASHDADFCAGMRTIAENCHGKLGVVAFDEYLSGDFSEIPDLHVFDLETDIKAFECGPLPRLRVIDIADFDPTKYL
jgi:uncharacterized protein